MIPLAKALLCLDGEHVVESRTDRCPVCGSRALMPLANVLGLVNTSRELEKCAVEFGEEKEVAESTRSHGVGAG